MHSTQFIHFGNCTDNCVCEYLIAELPFKQVSCPVDHMLDFIREELDSTNSKCIGNLVVVDSPALSHVRHHNLQFNQLLATHSVALDHLCVPLSALCALIQQRLAVLNALLVHVSPSLVVV